MHHPVQLLRRATTIDFADQFGIQRGMHLLDIGCGLGGASRYFAHDRGCRVTGIDLTEEYVHVAGALARMLRLGELVSYKVGSALSLAFSSGTFDGAYMLHVGMNVEDKAKLFAEVRRVLKPKGLFAIYDVMREADGELSYPVPWATTPQMSFVMTAANYRHLLGAAGFEVMEERSRREFAIEFFRELRPQVAQTGPPPLGLHIVMGATYPQKVANMINNLEQGLIAPTEIICRAV